MNFKRTIFALVVIGATSLFAKNDDWKLNKSCTLKDDKIVTTGKGSAFILPKKKEILTEMEFEAEITPVKAESKSWKVVGLALYKSPTEYWHFAFIESPEKSQKRHFVELNCKKDKVWGHQNKIKLKRIKGKSFKWEYGKTYKFKLKLTPERLDGFVYAKGSDKPLAHIAYALKDGTVKTGMPALRYSYMSASFSNIK